MFHAFIPSPFQTFRCGESPVEGEAVRVQIRFPSGEKTERKFALEDTVEVRNLAIDY